MGLLHLYRRPALPPAGKNALLTVVRQKLSPHIIDLDTEHCFNVEAAGLLTPAEGEILRWLLSETFEPD
ncbi:MAG: hypothetical protein Q7U68_02085, partial [Candidatus Roizmanbacteria bacterium]|nr:hypothetical protein [Candidatus Roizmanbacteria bacterium]